MKSRITLATMVTLVGVVALFSAFAGRSDASKGARGDQYAMDTAHAAVVFRITHLGFSYTYGRFNEIDGAFEVNEADHHGTSFKFSAKSASIDTNHKKRDDHLRSPDFFNARQFPTITFASTHIPGVDNGNLNVKGDLTLLGVTKPVSFTLEKMGEGKGPHGKHRIGYSSEFKIKRSDFGMTYGEGAIGNDVELMISFEGIRK